MTDELNDDDASGEGQGENRNLKHLREKAERADQAEAKLAAAERENALLKAGVDPDSPAGKMFFKGYDGDLEDIEAVRTAAQEVGALKGGISAEPSGDEGSATGDTETEPTGTAERQALAEGAPADTGIVEDPRKIGQERFDQALKDGHRWDQAAGEMLNTLAEAAANGDQRVIA